MESEYEEEFITKEEYLKNLDLQDFLNCDETSEILEMEFYNNFELGLKKSLMRVFENCAKTYSSDDFLYQDFTGEKNSDVFSEIVYKYIIKNYDLTIFYDNPNLAKKLLK